MADFNVRSDSVNVEHIMEQIRARIREKRGADYTEQQIQELAAVKLEKFLDPRGVRSDLLEQFRRAQPPYSPPELPNYEFEEHTLFESHRGPLRLIRKLLQPILKLFFNPNRLIQALNIQSRLNTIYADREAKREAQRHASDQLHYELFHNLVIETTRLGIEVKNLKMRVESLTSRLEFNERRARALESVVVYKPEGRPEAPAPQPQPQPQRRPAVESASTPSREGGQREGGPRDGGQPQEGQNAPAGEGPGQRSRRRRRRRGRRGGGAASTQMGVTPAAPGDESPENSLASQEIPPGRDAEFDDDGPEENGPGEGSDSPGNSSSDSDDSQS